MNELSIKIPFSSPRKARHQGRWIVAGIVAMCLLPILLGGGLYLTGWRPLGGASHGTLLQTPAPLPAGLTQADGRPLDGALLKEKWSLVLVDPAPCASACRERLIQMRQVQVALNKEMGRLRRVAVVTDTGAPALAEMLAAQPDLKLARADGRWFETLGGSNGPQIYVLDPQGRAVMRYGPQATPQGMRRDLERLLKYSWVG